MNNTTNIIEHQLKLQKNNVWDKLNELSEKELKNYDG